MLQCPLALLQLFLLVLLQVCRREFMELVRYVFTVFSGSGS